MFEFYVNNIFEGQNAISWIPIVQVLIQVLTLFIACIALRTARNSLKTANNNLNTANKNLDIWDKENLESTKNIQKIQVQ